MAVTPQEVAAAMSAAGYTPNSLEKVMGRLASIDTVTRLVSKRALMVARHESVRANQDAELGALDTEIAAARAAADSVVGGGA